VSQFQFIKCFSIFLLACV